jgi:hypothetical protein
VRNQKILANRRAGAGGVFVTCSWTYEHYSNCIQKARAEGYALVSFKEMSSYQMDHPLIVLRHDIDYSLQKALNMARMEKYLGVHATYFIRVHARSYNIFEYKNYLALKEIASLGHEIGLHLEAIDFAYITGEHPLDVFQREKKVLEAVLNTAIISVSAHGEHSPAGPRHNRSFFDSISKKEAGIQYDAYEAPFTMAMKYISDSSGRWREGCMCKHIGKYPRLQILTHPCWWFKEHLFE